MECKVAGEGEAWPADLVRCNAITRPFSMMSATLDGLIFFLKKFKKKVKKTEKIHQKR